MLTINDFRNELTRLLNAAEAGGASYSDVNSGELHRRLGNYPDASRHRMPSCCDAMYAEHRAGDKIVSRPSKGKGASLTIRYKLPR